MAKLLEFQKGGQDLVEKSKSRARLYLLAFFGAAILVVAGILYFAKNFRERVFPFLYLNKISQHKKHTFEDRFNQKVGKKIEETGKMSQSSSKKWWVNSGGWLEISDGTAKTIQGNLSSGDKWHKAYQSNNPADTDDGAHPQNIFRLVTREKWQNFRQQAYFKINKINLSESENRNESNGILLFNRYQDGDDLYYTGLRVDGYAVIKKKIGGDYHTLALEKVFKGEDYGRDSNPNLLPIGKWIGLRSEVKTNRDGDVEISLFYKKGRKARKNWKLVARCVDKGQEGAKIIDSGYGGIRTDFADVEFDKYKIREL